MTPVCIMMIGIAGSGKSTLAQNTYNHAKESNIDVRIFSSDEIRARIYGDATCQDNPKRVFEILHNEMIAHLRNGGYAIYDATNLRANRRKEIITRIRRECPTCIIVGHVAQITAEEAIARQELRERKVPAEVIRRQLAQLQLPTVDEGFDYISGV